MNVNDTMLGCEEDLNTLFFNYQDMAVVHVLSSNRRHLYDEALVGTGEEGLRKNRSQIHENLNSIGVPRAKSYLTVYSHLVIYGVGSFGPTIPLIEGRYFGTTATDLCHVGPRYFGCKPDILPLADADVEEYITRYAEGSDINYHTEIREIN